MNLAECCIVLCALNNIRRQNAVIDCKLAGTAYQCHKSREASLTSTCRPTCYFPQASYFQQYNKAIPIRGTHRSQKQQVTCVVLVDYFLQHQNVKMTEVTNVVMAYS